MWKLVTSQHWHFVQPKLQAHRMNPSIKATIAQVFFGSIEIEGLLGEDNEFYVAVPQVSNTFQFDNNQASRYLKTMLGASFQFVKMRTTLNPKAVNVIRLIDFEKVVRELDRRGNVVAKEIVDDMLGLSFAQLFNDAFQIKFNREDRVLFLQARDAHRQQFHSLYTDWLKLDGCTKGWEYGEKVNELKKAAKVELVCLEGYSDADMRKLNNAEVIYDAMRRAGKSHSAALQVI